MIGRLIGAVRLGKPFNCPSALVGVIVSKDFKFPETITIETVNSQGNKSRRVIRITYPCIPTCCQSCQGFGHTTYGGRTWAMVVGGRKGNPGLSRQAVPIVFLPVTSLVSSPAPSLNLLSNEEGEWHTGGEV